jgi:hypothetical protein
MAASDRDQSTRTGIDRLGQGSIDTSCTVAREARLRWVHSVQSDCAIGGFKFRGRAPHATWISLDAAHYKTWIALDAEHYKSAYD